MKNLKGGRNLSYRKIKTLLLIAGFLVFIFLGSGPSRLLAADNIPTPQQAADELCQKQGTCPIKSPNDIFVILRKIVQWTYLVFFVVAIFFILLAAYNFLFARGDPEKIKNARGEILWASVAIAIALVSIGAAQIINSFLQP